VRKLVRTFGLVAAVAASVGLSTPSASAAGAAVIVFQGTAHINCFGCGTSTGTASLGGTGVRSSNLAAAPEMGAATASYTVQEDAGVSCVVTGSADGTVTGFVNVTFHWLRVGALAVITTAGDVTGAGVAGFEVKGPDGNPLLGVPCGGPVDANVAGAVAGTTA
jgi:hypothetical protein